MGDKSVAALAIDPNDPSTVYAGTSYGLFKTTNGGANWSEINNGLTNLNVYALAIAPATPSTVYAGTSNSGVYKTTDAGANWSEINTGPERINYVNFPCHRPQ